MHPSAAPTPTTHATTSEVTGTQVTATATVRSSTISDTATFPLCSACDVSITPVCGTRTGQMFRNPCYAACNGEESTDDCSGLQLSRPPTSAPTEIDLCSACDVSIAPVCGARTGQMFRNPCFAACNGEESTDCSGLQLSRPPTLAPAVIDNPGPGGTLTGCAAVCEIGGTGPCVLLAARFCWEYEDVANKLCPAGFVDCSETPDDQANRTVRPTPHYRTTARGQSLLEPGDVEEGVLLGQASGVESKGADSSLSIAAMAMVSMMFLLLLGFAVYYGKDALQRRFLTSETYRMEYFDPVIPPDSAEPCSPEPPGKWQVNPNFLVNPMSRSPTPDKLLASTRTGDVPMSPIAAEKGERRMKRRFSSGTLVQKARPSKALVTELAGQPTKALIAELTNHPRFTAFDEEKHNDSLLLDLGRELDHSMAITGNPMSPNPDHSKLTRVSSWGEEPPSPEKMSLDDLGKSRLNRSLSSRSTEIGAVEAAPTEEAVGAPLFTTLEWDDDTKRSWTRL